MSEQPDSFDDLEENISPGDAYFASMRRRRWLKMLGGALALVCLYWFVPPVWQLEKGPITVTRWQRVKGETEATVGPGRPGWMPVRKISKHLLHAIVVAEDGRFYQHHGLDLEETWNSLKLNIKKHRYARGGSTLTQQVVKVAFLSREKSLIRKAREAVGALLLEQLLSKDRILEWYINLAEFGDGVYGITDGCWHYFKTKPELLTIEQSAHLALVLPSPNAWSYGLRHHALTSFGHRRFATIINRMRRSGYITKTQWASALTRGDFGRPIHGYAGMLAAEEQQHIVCPGNPECPDNDDDLWDEEADELSFPKPEPSAMPVPLMSLSPPPASSAGAGTTPGPQPTTAAPAEPLASPQSTPNIATPAVNLPAAPQMAPAFKPPVSPAGGGQ